MTAAARGQPIRAQLIVGNVDETSRCQVTFAGATGINSQAECTLALQCLVPEDIFSVIARARGLFSTTTLYFRYSSSPALAVAGISRY